MKIAASVLSAGLYAAALILFLTGAKKRAALDRDASVPSLFSPREYGWVLMLCCGSLAVHMGVISGVRLFSGSNTTLADTFRIYAELDSQQYLDIARVGYTVASENGTILELVFFPGYPLVVRLLMLVFPEGLSGYLAAWIPFLMAGMVLYRLFRLDYEKEKSLRLLLWICLFPGAMFFSTPMSESLFLLTAAGAFYLARTRRWFAAGICGFLASFTRLPGVLLAIPLGIELLEQYAGNLRANRKELIRNGSCLLLLPLAVCIYLGINRAVTGDSLAFLQYQREHWGQRIDWFFKTAAMQTDYAVHSWTDDPHDFWALWLPNLLVGYGSLILMLLRGRKLRLPEGSWFFVYFAVCYGTTWLLSGPRYMTVFFPMAVLVEEAPLSKWVKAVLLGACTITYALFFARRWNVW